MLTWVVYDVAATPKRTKIAKACKDTGLYRVSEEWSFLETWSGIK